MNMRIASAAAAFLAVSLLCVAEEGGDRIVWVHSPGDFDPDPKPVPLGEVGNPLDYAGARIGMNARDFELPRGDETYYRFACRFPVIDSVSNQPLYMKQWAEDESARISAAHTDKGIGAVEDALGVLTGWNAPPAEAPELSKEFEDKFASAGFTPKYRAALLNLVRGFLASRHVALGAIERLSAAEIEFLDRNPGYYIAPDGKTMPSLTGSVDTHLRFAAIARKVGFDWVFRASRMLASAVRAYAAATKGFGEADFLEKPDPLWKGFSQRIGRAMTDTIAVFGTRDDSHHADALLEIDLGGNDTWTNNAGSCWKSGMGAALCIDHGGCDKYVTNRKARLIPGSGGYVKLDFSAGFGFLGSGFLVDLGGDDRYEGGHFCQGAGILGVGVLWDAGGDDVYTANAFCQGAAVFGLGMLLDSAGEDMYDCATLGQGAASTMGLGVCSDLEGDDRYHLNVGPGKDALNNLPGYGQGGALSFRHMPWRGKLTPYGGIGMLVDSDGNDRYRSQGWCDQGGSYIMSLGVLADFAGNDHYSAGTGQGSGIHITNAILVDRGGHDVYDGGFRTGGSGGDRSPGFLIDYGGNDTYRSRTSSYGTGVKPFSYSLFIDYGGDDAYICPEPKGRILFNNWDSFGGVWPESEPNLWPYAICLDLGGRDDYRVRNRANDSERLSFGHGIHVDMEWKGGDVIGRVADPLEPYRAFALPQSAQESPACADLEALQSPDAFLRFEAVGRLVAAGPGIMPVLADALMASTHRGFNRDVMECVHHFLAAGPVPAEFADQLKRLFAAPDAEVRALAVDDFGIWAIKSAEDALLEKARTDPDENVRRLALRSLILTESAKAPDAASAFAVSDPSDAARYQAVTLVGRLAPRPDTFDILSRTLAKDPCAYVRVSAADGLGRLGDQRAVPLLRQAAQSGDFYLMRAAGRGLANLGLVEGIEVLIKSLAFPSIDAFYNYNVNVANDISAYAGFDLPEDRRYEQEKWQAWFDANKDKIDIRKNAEAGRKYTEFARTLTGAAPMEVIAKLEEFLQKFPGNPKASKTLAGTLNSEAWIIATAPPEPGKPAPADAVKMARRAVELDPKPEYIDTLAEALIAAGEVDEAERLCAAMLEKMPGERMFAEKLERCRKIRDARGAGK